MVWPEQSIAFLEDRLHDGIGRVLVNLSNTLVSLGISVDLLVKKIDGPYFPQLSPKIRVYKLATLHRVSGVPGVLRYLWRRHPTVVIVSSERLAAIALTAGKLTVSPPKIFVCVHNFEPNWIHTHVSPKYSRKLRRIRYYYPRCDRVICVSAALRSRFIRETGMAPDHVVSIYNPVITHDFRRLADEPANHPWFQESGVPVILAASRLEPQKDLATLIKAVARVSKLRACRLLILGEGSLRSELEHLIVNLKLQEVVELRGEVANPYHYMRCADLFVLSSIYEGLGNVLVEALACGTPVISTDCPCGPAEILDQGRYGQLVPVGDVSALASAIERTLSMPVEPDSLRSAAERFDAVTIARQYLELCGFR